MSPTPPDVTLPEESLESITRPFLDMLQTATGLESVYLTRINWEAGEQEIVHSLNQGTLQIPEGLQIEWSDTLCRRAMLGGPQRTADVPGDYGDSAAARDLKLQSYVTCPVVEQDHTIWGTICGASSDAVQVDDKAMDLIKQVAGMIAERVAREEDVQRGQRTSDRERARLEAANAHLQEASMTDQLTGLDNRRAFDDKWRLELENARRVQFPVSVLLLDLDGFKDVNDSQGHPVGDEVLKRIAEMLQKQVRDIDHLARIGGDQFVIGLSHADALVGEHVFKRVRGYVAAPDFGGREGPRGVSGGIASSSTTAAPDLLDAADRALRQAKADGGNRAQTWHGELLD